MMPDGFPDVARVVPAGGAKQMLFKTAELRSAIAAVAGHHRDIRATKIELDADGATISAAYVNLSLNAAVKVSCDHRHAGFTVGFNGGYLADVLAAKLDALVEGAEHG